MPAGTDIVRWHPSVGETGDDRYRWPEHIPITAGIDYPQGLNADGFVIPGMQPSLANVRENFGINQVIAEINRRLLNVPYDKFSLGAIAQTPTLARGRQGNYQPTALTGRSGQLTGQANFVRGFDWRPFGFATLWDDPTGQFDYTGPSDGNRFISYPTRISMILAAIFNRMKELIWQIEAIEGIRPHFSFTKPVRDTTTPYAGLPGSLVGDPIYEQEIFEIRKALATDHIKVYPWFYDTGSSLVRRCKTGYPPSGALFPFTLPDPVGVLSSFLFGSGGDGTIEFASPQTWGVGMGVAVLRTGSTAAPGAPTAYGMSLARIALGIQVPYLPDGVNVTDVVMKAWTLNDSDFSPQYITGGSGASIVPPAYFGTGASPDSPDTQIKIVRVDPVLCTEAQAVIFDTLAGMAKPFRGIARAWEFIKTKATIVGTVDVADLATSPAFVDFPLDDIDGWHSCHDMTIGLIMARDWDGVVPPSLSSFAIGKNFFWEAENYGLFTFKFPVGGGSIVPLYSDWGMAYDGVDGTKSGFELSCFKLYLDDTGTSSSSSSSCNLNEFYDRGPL